MDIAKANPGVAGMVILAGPTRSFQNLLIDTAKDLDGWKKGRDLQ